MRSVTTISPYIISETIPLLHNSLHLRSQFSCKHTNFLNYPQTRYVLYLSFAIPEVQTVIRNNLVQVLTILIHSDQVGFVIGRQARDATRCLNNLIKNAELKRTPFLLLSLDAENVFNRGLWGYLKAVLQKIGITGWF